MGRLTGTTTQYSFLPGYNFQNAYAYDAASNRTWLVAPDGSSNQYGYDALNRLQTLTNSLTGQFGFSYDALSRRMQLTRPNGINTNYSYDAVSHLLSALHQSGSTTLDGASYTYDFAGNRTSKTNYLNGITEGYSYDLIYQLTQVAQGLTTTESYSYDAVGNRLSSLSVPTYNYNSSNELTSSSNGSYTYDNNGNTLTDASGQTYTWDFENRMMQAVIPGTGTTIFKYDPFGRRIQKSGPNGTTSYLYDGARIVDEADGNGNLQASYTQYPTVDQPLAQFRSNAPGYYGADGLGSITSVTTAAGGFAATYRYDGFGNPVGSTGSTINPFRYAGREFDTETERYYYRARYLDSTVGRFLSEDPIWFAGGANFYQYAAGDPIRFIDPFGTCLIEMFVVPTGEHSDGFFYHSFLVLAENGSGPLPVQVFRGGPSLGGGPTGPLVDADLMPLNHLTPDQPSDSVYSASLLNNNCGCQRYRSKLDQLITEIDRSRIPYGSTYNSNSVTSTGIQSLDLPLPVIPLPFRVRMPGWGNSLPLAQPAGGGGGNAF